MFDLGYFKLPFFVASCILVAATFLTAQCTEYWHFLLCQGLTIGVCSWILNHAFCLIQGYFQICCGTLYGPAMAIISHWFRKRRGIALGLTATGSSVGGTVFPIAAKKLINDVGYAESWKILLFRLNSMCQVSVGYANSRFHSSLYSRLCKLGEPGYILPFTYLLIEFTSEDVETKTTDSQY